MSTLPPTILDPSHADRFCEYLKLVQSAVHKIASDHGWWKSGDADNLESIATAFNDHPSTKEILLNLSHKLRERNDGEILSLMHSELSEALEFHRHGNPTSDHIPEFSGIEEELADVVIRVFDYAERRGFRLGPAIVAKMAFNHGRPYRHGGKAI